jgi:hypothetical protein
MSYFESTLHHVTMRDVQKLEEVFAVYTPDGWVIPGWLKLLKHTCRYP